MIYRYTLSLEIVVDLWIEYPFSPFLRQRIALFEQLKIVKLMDLFPNSSREQLSKRYLRRCSFNVLQWILSWINVLVMSQLKLFSSFALRSLYGFVFFDVISLCMICMRRSGDLYCLGSEWCNFSSRSQHTDLLSRSGVWPSWRRSFIALQYSGYFASSSPIVSVVDCML